MADNPPAPHAKRSAELQRLLDEAAHPTAAPAAQLTVHRLHAQHNPADRTLLPPPSRRKPDSSANPGADSAGDRPSPKKRSASSADRLPTQRSPLQSSPPSTFPRRVAPTVVTSTGAPATAAGRQVESAADPSDRLRRSALVRTPISGSGVRRKGAERSRAPGADAVRPRIVAEEEGRPRAGNRAVGTGRRGPSKAVSAANKTAVTRALAGRWGAAGFVPEQPGYRPAFDAQSPEQQRRVQPAVAPGDLAVSARERTRAPRKPAVDRRPVVPAPASTQSTTSSERKVSTALPPPTDRARQRRPVVVAGGIAAAVVAVVAIVSIGNRSGSNPAADATPNPARVVTVQSIGADGRTAMTTVTAPVSTVNGAVVALVPDANGRIQRLTVVTATPPAPATASSTPRSTAASPRSTVRQVGGATGTSSSGTPAQLPATASNTRSSATTSAAATPTPTAGPAPADPGDVATVITGLTTLTGWVPVTTR